MRVPLLTSSLLALTLLSTASAHTLSPRSRNATDDALMQCIYPISGAYGLLPRVLYYCTLILAIFGRNQEWLVIGALASGLAYAGTAAIHAMALATSRKYVFDLDIIGAWAVLSTGALAYITLINWSTTIRHSRAKVVMICWGCLVGIGLIFGRVEQYDTHLTPGETPCYSSEGNLLVSPVQLVDARFNCTYECFKVRKPMRDVYESVAIHRSMLTSPYSKYQSYLIGPVMFAAYAAISWDAREHSPSQMCTRLVMKFLSPKHHVEILKSIYNASSHRWYGGYFTLFNFVHRAPWSARKISLAVFLLPWVLLGLLVDFLCIPLMITNVVLNELLIARTGLPTNESPYSVGQWGPVVSSALVVVAAIINKILEVKERRQNAKDIPREEQHVPLPMKRDEPELEGQTSGVVMKSVKRQETLREIAEVGAVYKP